MSAYRTFFHIYCDLFRRANTAAHSRAAPFPARRRGTDLHRRVSVFITLGNWKRSPRDKYYTTPHRHYCLSTYTRARMIYYYYYVNSIFFFPEPPSPPLSHRRPSRLKYPHINYYRASGLIYGGRGTKFFVDANNKSIYLWNKFA